MQIYGMVCVKIPALSFYMGPVANISTMNSIYGLIYENCWYFHLDFPEIHPHNCFSLFCLLAGVANELTQLAHSWLVEADRLSRLRYMMWFIRLSNHSIMQCSYIDLPTWQCILMSDNLRQDCDSWFLGSGHHMVRVWSLSGMMGDVFLYICYS